MVAKLLQSIQLFQSLPINEIHYLAETLTQRDYPAGTLIVREGHPASRFHIVVEGRVEIIKAIDTKDERLLAVHKAGAFIGEMGLLSEEGLHTATVRALSPIKMLEMSREEFDALLRRHPALGYAMVRTLSNRLNHSENLTIRDLRRKNRELTRAYKELESAQAALVEKERLERELEVAREIQSSILPHKLPVRYGFNFGALMVPMSAVGGDFYDFIPLGKDRLGIAIGDVSDHGVPAALFMAMTVTLLRAETRRAASPTPREALLNINRQLLEMNEMGIFVTMLYGELNYKTREFSYVRAGHEPPILCNSLGVPREIPMGQGQLMGILDEPVLDENHIQLNPGSTLLLFTDGVNEASNSREILYGRQRIKDKLTDLRDKSAQETCNHILRLVSDFRGRESQQDDITLVALQVK